MTSRMLDGWRAVDVLVSGDYQTTRFLDRSFMAGFPTWRSSRPMLDKATSPEAYVYTAFISYRHAEVDRRWAQWLHSRLEQYRLPRRLRKERGLPRKIGRCFRDEEELATSSSLSLAIDRALQESKFLIVVCSPRTPASLWVNAEVKRFRELGRGERILALLAEGEPHTSFPPALVDVVRSEDDRAGDLFSTADPLAADVRPNQRGHSGHARRLAILRLVATLLNVSFDDLRQRDHERRVRRAMYTSTVLGVLLMLMTVLTVIAASQKAEAVRQRQAAQTSEARATRSSQLAEERRSEAERSARKVRKQLAESYVDQGISCWEADDPSLALLWFVKALEACPDDPDLARFTRVRFAASTQVIPRLLDTGEAPKWADPKIVRAGRELEIIGNKLVILDSVTRKPLLPPIVEALPIDRAVFSPDGSSVATVIVETARVWSCLTGKLISPNLRHKRPIRSVDFSPDGKKLVTASEDGTAVVWDIVSGKPFVGPLLHKDFVTSAKFSPDGKKVLTACDDGHAVIRDWEKGAKSGHVLHHDGRVTVAIFSPDGAKIGTASDDHTACIWDTTTGALARRLVHSNPITSMVFSQDGSRVATASEIDSTARVWDVSTGRALTPLLRHDGHSSRVVFGPESRELGVGVPPHVWDLPEAVKEPLLRSRGLIPLSFSKDCSKVLVSKEGGGVQLVDSSTARPLSRTLMHPSDVRCAALNGDGTRAATVSFENILRVWDVARGHLLFPPVTEKSLIASLGFSPDGGKLFTISSDYSVRTWDASTGQLWAGPLRHVSDVTVSMSPDGKKLLTGDLSLAPHLFDALSGRRLSGPSYNWTTGAGAFSPDGEHFMTIMQNHATIHSMEPGHTTWFDNGSEISLAIFGSNSMVLTAGDRAARLWDAETGGAITPPLPHTGRVISASFDRTGRELATACDDDSSRVWDCTTGKPLTPRLKAGIRLRSVHLGNRGTTLVSVTEQGSVTKWDLRPIDWPIEELREFAELLAGRSLDAHGSFLALAPLTGWKKRWDDLRARHPELFRRPHKIDDSPSGVARTSPPHGQDELIKYLHLRAQMVFDAYSRDDYDTVADLTYTKLIEIFGGRENFIRFVRRALGQDRNLTKEIEMYGPMKIFGNPHREFAVVEVRSRVSINGSDYSVHSFLLAVSNENETMWTFVGSETSVSIIRAMFPDLPSDLALPEVQVHRIPS